MIHYFIDYPDVLKISGKEANLNMIICFVSVSLVMDGGPCDNTHCALGNNLACPSCDIHLLEMKMLMN